MIHAQFSKVPALLKRGSQSIQFKLISYFFLIALVPLIILGVTTYQASSAIIIENETKEANQVMGQVIENIDYYLQDMDNISKDIFFNRTIISDLYKYKGSDDGDDINAKNEIRSILTSILSGHSSIKAISIVSKDTFFSTSYGFVPDLLMKEVWYQKALEKGGEMILTAVNSQKYKIDYFGSQAGHLDSIVLAKQLKNIYTGRRIGVIFIEIDYPIIAKIIAKLNPDVRGSIFLLDGTGKIIYEYNRSPAIHRIFSGKSAGIRSAEGMDTIQLSGQKMLRIFQTSHFSQWKMVEVIPYNILMAPVNAMRNLTITLALICIILVLAVSVFISDRVLKPIKRLSQLMNEVEAGNLEVRISIANDDEVGRLGNSFNNMILNLIEMRARIYQEQELKRQAELSALQAQINPHFLYNTLDSIKWMAMAQGDTNIAELITALVGLLRSSVNRGQEIITIRQEINNVGNFIKIQQVRYYNRFELRYDIDEATLDYGIPKLILQPLVENALFHGLENKLNAGVIQLKISRETDLLRCEVSDNGKGMSQEELENIYTIKNNSKFSGISVKNVDERLKLHFGPEYGLEFQSVLGAGTRAIVKLPVILLTKE